ncbi:MAG: hypothetical protein IKQ10_05695 [Oscillospiraceae bacterium]|nr:hypothetical protein [Oscillospiraceae bacterium]
MDPLIARDYIEHCLKIRTKSGAVIPFRLNAAQRKLYDVAKRQQQRGRGVRIIILKARQLGFSTLTEGLIFHACATRPNTNALIVTHREDATANLFRMSKLFYDELPEPIKPMLRTSNAQELVFENPTRSAREKAERPGLRSRLRCATAGGKGIGRSDTLQCVHLSEYAFWPEGSDGKAATLTGILQAVPSMPGTMVVIESTANGYEDFKDRWDAAVAGENDFEAVFFAWFENPEYVMEPVPGTEWTPDELEMQARCGLTDAQLQWRRWCIANNCGGSLDMFRQEYPSNPDEAFLHSGTGVFDNEQVILRRETAPEPVKRGRFVWEEDMRYAWEDDPLGEIRIWKEPEEGRPYVLGGDTAGEGSDWFTAHVIDNVTGEQVASLRRQYSEPEYVRAVFALGRYYNDALVGIETNFSTYPVMKLDELGYPNQYSREREDTYTRQVRKSYGFRTDRNSRPRAIAGLVEIFSAHPQWFRDRELLGEMLSFVYNEDHRPEALAGKHDDLVMAAAICYAVRHQQRTSVIERPEPKHEKLIDKLERRQRRRRRR